MSSSTTLLDLIHSTQAEKEVAANALFDAASPGMLWGNRYANGWTYGLNWGYYGGTYQNGATSYAISNGQFALAANATNYVYASATNGAVSSNTTGFPAGSIPLYAVVTNSSSIASFTDYRSYMPSAIAGVVNSIASEGSGVSLVDSASTASAVKLKQLVAGAGLVITDNGASGLSISAGSSSGTVTGGANEGSGTGVFDATNSTSTTLKFKTLLAGTSVTITDGGTSGITIAASAGAAVAPATQQSGTSVITATQTLNFAGGAVITQSGSTATISLSASSSGISDTAPTLSGFTAAGQTGLMTGTQQAWGAELTMASQSGENVGAYVKTAPATPYSIVARLKMLPINSGGYLKAGLCWYDGTKYQICGWACQSNMQCGVTNMNSATSYSGFAYQSSTIPFLPEWHRLRDDGTNRYYDVSVDGADWLTLYTQARTNFLTPTYVGFCVDPNQSVGGLTVFSWTGA